MTDSCWNDKEASQRQLKDRMWCGLTSWSMHSYLGLRAAIFFQTNEDGMESSSCAGLPILLTLPSILIILNGSCTSVRQTLKKVWVDVCRWANTLLYGLHQLGSYCQLHLWELSWFAVFTFKTVWKLCCTLGYLKVESISSVVQNRISLLALLQ